MAELRALSLSVLTRMVLTDYAKYRILLLFREGHRPPKIVKLLKDEGVGVSRQGVAKFLARFQRTGTIA